MNLVELAQRIRRLRVERGLTLEDVATRAGLTRGWLSKVENFRVTPSLPALFEIAAALGVSMSELFQGLEDRPALTIVRRDERLTVRRDEEESNLVYESLAHRRPMRQMDPFVAIVAPHGVREPKSHPGEEFLHVLEGVVSFEYDGATHELREGDSAYFDGPRPHRLVNLRDTPARVMIVFCGLAPAHGAAENGSDEA